MVINVCLFICMLWEDWQEDEGGNSEVSGQINVVRPSRKISCTVLYSEEASFVRLPKGGTSI